MADDAKVMAALFKAYKAGSVSLSDVCPHCFKRVGGYMSHGVCEHCKRQCGCSFNAMSHNDHCDFHNGDAFK